MERITTPTFSWDIAQTTIRSKYQHPIPCELATLLRLDTRWQQTKSRNTDDGIFLWSLNPHDEYHGNTPDSTYPEATIHVSGLGLLSFASVIQDSSHTPRIITATYGPEGQLMECAITTDGGDVSGNWHQHINPKNHVAYPIPTKKEEFKHLEVKHFWRLTQPMCAHIAQHNYQTRTVSQFFSPVDPKTFLDPSGQYVVFAPSGPLSNIHLPYQLTS